mmetsp:Transcript_54351/g.90185  ORF Transcript_54351/g.90185 Transcript_54351/m.90185 type:complete len:302 (-) Transcript_54351:17-922(-)|eukprot:CAMPEP_0119311868 /NCGR_PEP_ID=MMETSP1333-20130426/24263_1 /TAXON_ID=418940 /ORGANISM="Scyphosphaera apsteinii, Strain RCC1455" /LENGTH=301 /DNA_ID=CAMNT_0007316363 /DNA_START=79 /DNA_END=984 /DNA_ORIENTATION=+
MTSALALSCATLLASNVQIAPGRNEMPAATLTTPGGTKAVVYISGAHVTSWQTNDGVEQLFLSSASAFAPGVAIRGGIPICFPQFSGRGFLPKHGFARISTWEIESVSRASEFPSLVLTLSDNEATRTMWPHSFKLRYIITLHENSLTTCIELRNTGSAPLTFTSALHTYLRVPDVTQVTVGGLGGLNYEDNAAAGKLCIEPPAATLSITGETDRVYLDAPDRLMMQACGKHRLLISKQGFRDVVLWNIGAQNAVRINDLGAGEWRNYICLEAGAVGEAVRLEPQQIFSASQTMEADLSSE